MQTKCGISYSVSIDTTPTASGGLARSLASGTPRPASGARPGRHSPSRARPAAPTPLPARSPPHRLAWPQPPPRHEAPPRGRPRPSARGDSLAAAPAVRPRSRVAPAATAGTFFMAVAAREPLRGTPRPTTTALLVAGFPRPGERDGEALRRTAAERRFRRRIGRGVLARPRPLAMGSGVDPRPRPRPLALGGGEPPRPRPI